MNNGIELYNDQQTETAKDASIFYNSLTKVNSNSLIRWLKKSKQIHWDYKT